MVLPMNSKNIVDRKWVTRKFKENRNYKETTANKQKVRVKIFGIRNVKGRFGEFNTHEAYWI